MSESIGSASVKSGLFHFPSLGRKYGMIDLPSREFLAATAVFFAVTFNFLLAAFNINVMYLTRGDVILAEVLIVALSLGVCIRSGHRLLIQWTIVAWLLAIIFITLSIFRGAIEAKYFRDILTVPLFIALGITYARGNIIKLFAVLQTVILTVMVFEGAFPVLFGEVVNPLSYYINTRDFKVEDFWNTESTLFVSATRPQDRFFDLIDIHRLSSVFLEPVSLGNWCIVVTVFCIVMWWDLSRKMKYFFILTNIVILVGCDGRLATVTSGIIVAISLIAKKLPRHSHFFYLPGAIFVAFLVVVLLNPPPGDTFLGRLEFSIRYLSGIDLDGLFGLSADLIRRSADSGISYIILTQSILGLAIFWCAICFLQATGNRRAVLLVHGVAAYVALSLLISYSMFSIKTAAALWFLFGYVRVMSTVESRQPKVLSR